MIRWWNPPASGGSNGTTLTCVDCGRPVVYVTPRTPYERTIRARQITHRLCERCARVAGEVGQDMDGLRRKRRFLPY